MMTSQSATNTTLKKVSALMRKGDLAAAIRLLEKAVKASPGTGIYHGQLASLYGMSGDYRKAVISAQQGASLEPTHPGHHFNLGSALVHLGRYKDAIPPLSRLAELDPENVAGLRMLQSALGSIGRHKEVISIGIKILNLQPGDIDSVMKMANANFCLHHFEYSRKLYNRVLAIEPENWKAQCGVAKNLCREGKIQAAIPVFKQILDKHPDSGEAIAGLALAHEINRDYEKAWEVARRVQEIANPTPDAIIAYARLASRNEAPLQAIELLERGLGKLPEHSETAPGIHHYLGKLYEKQGKSGKAFDYYERANRSKQSDFTPENDRKYISTLVSTFDHEYFATAPHASIKTVRPVFVLGMPRSGTSLVEQILDSHPEVCGAGELEGIRFAAHEALPSLRNPGASISDELEKISTDLLDKLAGDYLDELKLICRHASRVVDKMPHNFQHLWMIHLLFPDAPVIHCARDPRDTCMSIFTNQFSYWHGYSTDLEILGDYYLRYEQLMAHWEKTIEHPIITVQYETLVSNPEPEIRRILDFIGMDWDPACLEFYKNPRYTKTISYEQVRSPLNTRSIGRWKNFEPFLSPLLDKLARSPALANENI